MLKITVSGFISEVFIGNDEEVEKYLINLKKLQESNINEFDLKWYNKEMPKLKSNSMGRRYNELAEKYNNPNYKMQKFRSEHEKFGLKIKIEHISSNLF